MNRYSLDPIEFPKLLSKVSEGANCDASQRVVTGLMPLEDINLVRIRQSRISEIMRMSQDGTPLGLSPFRDISSALLKARPAGAVLEAAELAGFIPVLSITAAAAAQIHGRDDLPRLAEMTEGLTGFPDILRVLKKSVDQEGNILDTASFLLRDLRERIRRLEVKIVRKIEEIVRDERVSVFLQDDFITKRSGRWVIPVRMDSKGQVSGVVHDVSKSGETAFMEPLAIINLANELENLIAEQKAEEIRILRDISARVRGEADGIAREFSILVDLDALACIAYFSGPLSMSIPEINESGMLRLVQARHPLLALSFMRSGAGRRVVPLDVGLGGDSTVMVITGSNAGGKTIAIKTIGLLIAMALSGMPIPASSASSVPLMRELLVDIGDDQSIETNLSTFSAHIEHIASILERAHPRALVLIDELGTGTDPSEGAALACAVLSELRICGALVFATTHLADIKGYVHRTEGMVNASMEFDRQTFTPLYRLRTGEPGQSYALETARRYGLPDRIIAAARSMLGGMKVEFDNLVADLNRKRSLFEEQLRDLELRREELAGGERLIQERMEEASRREKEILAKAYDEAAETVLDVKRQMNALLDEFKKKEKAERREALKKAETIRQQIAEKAKRVQRDEEGGITLDDIKEGDTVFVTSLGFDAAVTTIVRRDSRIKVRSGQTEIEVPLSDLRRRAGRQREQTGSKTGSEGQDEPYVSRLSLIGMRVDEALSLLEPFLNHASLAGLSEVTIIHGIGTGALSRAVREHLTGHPLIKGFRPGKQPEGGGGVTIATLV
ncbi:MAG: endonuclease MutS2 [Nitrospiraceae bacterium]|nr:endonuclease MutS2 [Nitrospiraceae bacterium]